MFAGMSTQAAQMLDPNYTVLPVGNWFFMVASTFLVTIIGTIITDRLIEPRLTPYVPDESEQVQDIALNEKRGMRWAGITALVYVLIMVALVAPTNGLLRDPETHGFLSSPFMSGIIFFMMLLFLLPGLAYGLGAGTIKNDKDMVALMTKTITGLSGFLVLCFFAAQFTSLFDYSKLGTIISVVGANALESIGFKGLPLLIAFVVLTAVVDIFISVDSAKWAIMAPIFVPMFMQLGLVSRGDTGSLPDWRLYIQHYRAHDALLPADSCFLPEV